MSYFQTQGRSLLANGFLIIPIWPGKKSPAIEAWQHVRIGAADLTDYPTHGVGVLCGQGAHPIAAVDIDTTNAVLASRFAEWCSVNLGATCERVGNAPKILLVYRAENAGWGKATGAWFEDNPPKLDRDGRVVRHRLEVLNHGQQFVAYHIHPDTKQPYEWTDLFGGLEHMRADELPVVTAEQINEALAVFAQMAAEEGLVQSGRGQDLYVADDDDFLGNISPPVGIELTKIKKALVHINAEDYESWLRVGMALHHEYSGDDSALDAWDEWSSSASNYKNRRDIENRWRSFDDSGRCATVRWILKIANQKEREQARVEKRAALVDLQDRINACDDSIDLLDTDGALIRAAQTLLAATPALRAEVGAALKRRYKEITGTALPVAELSRALRQQSVPTVMQRRPLTEFGNSERMLDKYGRGLMYVPETDNWYCWTGIYWRRAPDVEIEHFAKETVRALSSEKVDETDMAEFFKFCAISQQAKMVGNMVRLAKSDPRVAVPANELDKQWRYLGVRNGVVDMTTGDLLPPDPELRITQTTSCDFLPGVGCPLWEATVSDVFNGDADMIDFFQRLVGYCAMGNPTQDIMVIPYGNGSNGKSTIFGMIRAVLGGYAKAAEAGSFVNDSGKGGGSAGGAREDLVRLKGARFVYVNEPDENSELREGAVKAMTGGDVITARGVFAKATVEIIPSWVAVMPTNHKPIVKGSDNGIWRRLVLIPFERNFENDPTVKKDPDRKEKLEKEAPGILNWIIAGALSYQKIGLKKAGVVQKAVDDYRESMDLLAEWLEECCEIGGGHFVNSNALWKSWEEYAKNRGLLQYVKNSVSLGRRLELRFPAAKGTGGVRIRKGLRLKEFETLF